MKFFTLQKYKLKVTDFALVNNLFKRSQALKPKNLLKSLIS